LRGAIGITSAIVQSVRTTGSWNMPLSITKRPGRGEVPATISQSLNAT
jgi:hypothetical protein